jgi:hypothetical protein
VEITSGLNAGDQVVVTIPARTTAPRATGTGGATRTPGAGGGFQGGGAVGATP